jgi:hypothetical protein
MSEPEYSAPCRTATPSDIAATIRFAYRNIQVQRPVPRGPGGYFCMPGRCVNCHSHGIDALRVLARAGRQELGLNMAIDWRMLAVN